MHGLTVVVALRELLFQLTKLKRFGHRGHVFGRTRGGTNTVLDLEHPGLGRDQFPIAFADLVSLGGRCLLYTSDAADD